VSGLHAALGKKKVPAITQKGGNSEKGWHESEESTREKGGKNQGTNVAALKPNINAQTRWGGGGKGAGVARIDIRASL